MDNHYYHCPDCDTITDHIVCPECYCDGSPVVFAIVLHDGRQADGYYTDMLDAEREADSIDGAHVSHIAM